MATTVVHQVGFRKSPALERFVNDKLAPLLRREHADGRLWSVEVFLRIGNRAADGRAVAYDARIAVKLPTRQRPLVAASEGSTARMAFAGALERIEKRMRREARMHHSGRRTVGRTHRTARAAKRELS